MGGAPIDHCRQRWAFAHVLFSALGRGGGTVGAGVDAGGDGSAGVDAGGADGDAGEDGGVGEGAEAGVEAGSIRICGLGLSLYSGAVRNWSRLRLSTKDESPPSGLKRRRGQSTAIR